MKYDFDKVIDRRNTCSAKWDYGESDVLPMWVADMDFESPPEIVDAITQRAAQGTFGYTLTPESYYQAIADWMQEHHRWEIKKDWVVITPGVIPALVFAVVAFSQPGDKVVIQSPVYHPFHYLIDRNNREIVQNTMNLVDGQYNMDYEGLENLLDEKTKLLILCSPHNPVGRVWKKDELLELAKICAENDVIIVADEIHSDIIMEGHSHTPLASLSDEIADNVITCTAGSKTFNLAGLECSNIIISNERLYDQFKSTASNLWVAKANMFGLLATQTGYTYGREWLDQLLKYLKGNFDFLVSYLKEHAPRIKPIPLEGTYLVWLDFREFGLPDMEIKDLLMSKAKVWLDFGPQFGNGGEGFQRMNIACPRTILEDGLRRIAEIFAALT
jgi:cystathionine beta-lyase